MKISIQSELHYHFAAPTDVLLQIEAAMMDDQEVTDGTLNWTGEPEAGQVDGEAGIGRRHWLRASGPFDCSYRAVVETKRKTAELTALQATPLSDLPVGAVSSLMPSYYCPSNAFFAFAQAEFGDLTGGARIAGIRDWISANLEYVPGSSGPETDARDTFVQRQGVCRDFAHLLITLARASAVPARFASVYAPDVVPQDFHAVAEVYLDGAWHLVDATGMATAEEMVRIGVGADAARVAFMTSFGPAEMLSQSVSVERVKEG
ncbi:transglutaminase-like domain-containing protein [Algicella marina]|uniref:Transglutaminase family protein n=1 Tax=Algicella marina TaxID=2683284 RepID=A0A6P1T2E7_9RHOB|nr:transglutaminase family protein [Algicella marina]QHQ37104.1 transglutaminase family protein [Algicella marina]